MEGVGQGGGRWEGVGQGGGEAVRPALGLAWASVVGTRITLHRDQTVDSAADCCKVGYPRHVVSSSYKVSGHSAEFDTAKK